MEKNKIGEDKKEYVRFLRALASEERISILQELEEKGKINASTVGRKFYMEQSTASHHLNILKQAKIIEPTKTGRNIYYRLREDRLSNFYQEFLKELHKKQAEKLEALPQKSIVSEEKTQSLPLVS